MKSCLIFALLAFRCIEPDLASFASTSQRCELACKDASATPEGAVPDCRCGD
jgi:hypothetical protein